MASGTARFITGKLGKIDKRNISIQTPSATFLFGALISQQQ